MQAKDGEINKYRTDCQMVDAEIKSLKEKLKGNITLIQAKDIIWNEIIEEMKAAWGSLTIVSEEKSIVKDFEEQVMADKHKTINRDIWAKRFIDFIDSKTDQELEENDIKDRILLLYILTN